MHEGWHTVTNRSMSPMPLLHAQSKSTEDQIQVEPQTRDTKCIMRFITIAIPARNIPAIMDKKHFKQLRRCP